MAKLPDKSQIPKYLQERGVGEKTKMPVKTIDVFGNTVFTSQDAVETVFSHSTKSVLVISADGAQLVRENPGLLKALDQGEGLGKKVGSGNEGQVFLIETDVISGDHKYVVKYIFQGENDRQIGLHTPGVDQMRLLQYFAKNSPVNFSFLKPVFASINLLVTEYVSRSSDFHFLSDLQSQTHTTEEVITAYDIDGVDKQQLENVVRMIKENPRRIQLINELITKIWLLSSRLEEWANSQFDELPFELVNSDFSFDDLGAVGNMRFSIDNILQLVQKYEHKSDYYQSQEFERDCGGCVTIIELGVGFDKNAIK